MPEYALFACFLEHPPESVLSFYDQYSIANEMLSITSYLAQSGSQGIFFNVAFDTALDAAKSITSIPVCGALESAIWLAKYNHSKVSVLAINNEEIPVNNQLFRHYCYADKLVSVETVDMPVFEIVNNRRDALKAMIENAKKAQNAGAEAIILGCTAMGLLADELQKNIRIPVLDTSIIGINLIDFMLNSKVPINAAQHPWPSNYTPVNEGEAHSIRSRIYEI